MRAKPNWCHIGWLRSVFIHAARAQGSSGIAENSCSWRLFHRDLSEDGGVSVVNKNSMPNSFEQLAEIYFTGRISHEWNVTDQIIFIAISSSTASASRRVLCQLTINIPAWNIEERHNSFTSCWSWKPAGVNSLRGTSVLPSIGHNENCIASFDLQSELEFRIKLLYCVPISNN